MLTLEKKLNSTSPLLCVLQGPPHRPAPLPSQRWWSPRWRWPSSWQRSRRAPHLGGDGLRWTDGSAMLPWDRTEASNEVREAVAYLARRPGPSWGWVWVAEGHQASVWPWGTGTGTSWPSARPRWGRRSPQVWSPDATNKERISRKEDLASAYFCLREELFHTNICTYTNTCIHTNYYEPVRIKGLGGLKMQLACFQEVLLQTRNESRSDLMLKTTWRPLDQSTCWQSCTHTSVHLVIWLKSTDWFFSPLCPQRQKRKRKRREQHHRQTEATTEAPAGTQCCAKLCQAVPIKLR